MDDLPSVYGAACAAAATDRTAREVTERVMTTATPGACVRDLAAEAIRLAIARDPAPPFDRLPKAQREALDAAGANGVRGLPDTLPALDERRVGTLLLEPGVERPGVVCPRCRWASADELRSCPVDGEAMQEHPNLIEWAVELAVEQDAQVLSLRHHNDLAEHDGIAAALRF